jgi:hypothetical protein
MYKHTHTCASNLMFVRAAVLELLCCAVESHRFWNHLWNWYPTQLSGESTQQTAAELLLQKSSSCLTEDAACTRVMALQLHCGAARLGEVQHVTLWCSWSSGRSAAWEKCRRIASIFSHA